MSKLLVILILAIIPQTPALASRDGLVMEHLKEKIATPKVAFKYLRSDSSRWDMFLYIVKGGHSEWVAMWPDLRKVADNAGGEQMDTSLSYALAANPVFVLSEVRRGWKNEKEINAVVERVCATVKEVHWSRSTDPVKEKVEVLKMIEQRLKRLKEIEDRDLSALKELCIEKLKGEERVWMNR